MANAAQRKTFVGAVVIGIHVLIGIGFIAVTAIKAVTQNRDIMDAALIKHEDEPPPKEPPPPPPDFKPPAVQAPILDLPQVAAPPPAIVVHEAPKPEPVKEAPKAPPPVIPAHLAKGVDLGAACQAFYPSASKRLSEEGSVVVLIYVAPNGRVTDSKIDVSSGIQRLDEATVKCVTSQGRFDPQKNGNEAVGSWQRMKYTWRLTS